MTLIIIHKDKVDPRAWDAIRDDIVLFQELAPFGIDRYDKVPIVNRNYIVGKYGLK